jgi:hypothetical protein
MRGLFRPTYLIASELDRAAPRILKFLWVQPNSSHFDEWKRQMYWLSMVGVGIVSLYIALAFYYFSLFDDEKTTVLWILMEYFAFMDSLLIHMLISWAKPSDRWVIPLVVVAVFQLVCVVVSLVLVVSAAHEKDVKAIILAAVLQLCPVSGISGRIIYWYIRYYLGFSWRRGESIESGTIHLPPDIYEDEDEEDHGGGALSQVFRDQVIGLDDISSLPPQQLPEDYERDSDPPYKDDPEELYLDEHEEESSPLAALQALNEDNGESSSNTLHKDLENTPLLSDSHETPLQKPARVLSFQPRFQWQDSVPENDYWMFGLWSIAPVIVFPLLHGLYIFAKSCSGQLSMKQYAIPSFSVNIRERATTNIQQNGNPTLWRLSTFHLDPIRTLQILLPPPRPPLRLDSQNLLLSCSIVLDLGIRALNFRLDSGSFF